MAFSLLLNKAYQGMYIIISLQIEFMKEKPCELLCPRSYKVNDKIDKDKLLLLKKGMSLNYQHHWIVGKWCMGTCWP
jgi:hypothetical protein